MSTPTSQNGRRRRTPHPDATCVTRLPRTERNFVVLTFAIGFIFFLANGFMSSLDPTLGRGEMAVMLFLFACIALGKGVKFRRGDRYHEYRFWEYPVVVGLAIAPPYAVAFAMAAVTMAYGLAQFVFTPQTRAHQPLLFGSVSVAMTFGAFIAAISGPFTYPLGFVAYVLFGELILLGYDATRGGQAFGLKNLRHGLGVRLGVAAFLSTTVSALVYVLGPERELLLVVPLTILVLYWLVDWRMAAVEQQAAWKHMESVSSKFIGELEEHKAITVALEESLQLFSARSTEIVLYATETEPASIWRLKSGPGQRIEVVIVDPEDTPVQPEDTSDSRTMSLGMGEKSFGYVTIEWDRSAPEKRTRATLTNTFGHAVAACVANTRHNKQVQTQAAEKAREAQRDPLTGMGNRAMLAELGPALLAEASDLGHAAVLIMFDLDGFKQINDTLSHSAGDEVLVEIARRLAGTVRSSDIVIRFGGDEFAILADAIHHASDAEQVAFKITRALAPPVVVNELHLSVEASIGMAVYPADGTDIDTLLRRADIALYEAKANGRGKIMRYTSDLDADSANNLYLATELRKATYSATELTVHYQPQVDLATGAVCGHEALARWQHPELGLLYPDKFIHLAEQSNLVRPFTLRILETVLADRARMVEVFPDSSVSVNLSARNLLDSGLPSDVRRLLAKYQVPASDLVLEVTETSTSNDVKAAERVLHELRALGCHIAMDDFGSGYATLESLRKGSAVSEIKIDRGFISDIATLDRDHRVARSLIEIAHAWNCRVVAEGVEDQATYELLSDLGCDIAQGYWLHKPAPLEAILDWGRARHGHAHQATQS